MDLNYAYLCFKGSADIYEITKQLSLQPTKCWNVGDKRKDGSTYKFSFWSYESKDFEKSLLDQSISEVINFIGNHQLNLNALSKNFDIYISCVGYHTNSFSGFFFQKK